MFDKRKSSGSEKQAAHGSTAGAAASGSAQASAPAQEPFTPRSNAMIGKGIKINGTVTGEENLMVEGTIEGTIELPNNDVTIGEPGKVEADLRAKVVYVDGQVSGDINGSEKVVISKSGIVRGNIIAPRVTLEDGAKFKGSIDMDPTDADTGSARSRSSKAAAEPVAPSPAKQEAG